MKKSLVLASIIALAMAFSTIVYAADSSEFHMNSRFWYMDNPAGTTDAESRWSLHCVEISAATEVNNIGGNLTYRIADQTTGLATLDTNADGIVAVTEMKNNTQSYPVEAKAYIKFGKASKVTAGLQFVPFAIYKWNNLYHPFLDKPGQNGLIWDADWGMLYTYDAKPVLLDIGYFGNAGELLGSRENAEKNTVTLRLGYDIFSNWNVGASFMKGDVDGALFDMDDDGDIDAVDAALCPNCANNLAQTDRTMWALDTTWKPYSNLQLQAEYIDIDLDEAEYGVNSDVNGDLGLLQVKYDVVKVPSPLDKISFVLQYSWEDMNGGGTSLGKEKNYQEEVWFQAGKNLHIFWQNVQEKVPGVDTNKYQILAFKYNLF